MLCYLKFHFKQKLCGEEHRYIASLFLFLFLKKPGLKNKKKKKKKKKIIAMSYLIIVLIKMRLLIFLVFSQYGLVVTME